MFRLAIFLSRNNILYLSLEYKNKSQILFKNEKFSSDILYLREFLDLSRKLGIILVLVGIQGKSGLEKIIFFDRARSANITLAKNKKFCKITTHTASRSNIQIQFMHVYFNHFLKTLSDFRKKIVHRCSKQIYHVVFYTQK